MADTANKKRFGIFSKLVCLVMMVVAVVLLTTTLFIRDYIRDQELTNVKDKMKSIANIVAKDELVKETVRLRKQSQAILDYTDQIMSQTDLEFVVVMDTQFIRYSHPSRERVGGYFSNLEDAQATINEGAHFSQALGTLGEGLRYFTPIYDNDGQIIGVICVGFQLSTITQKIYNAQNHINYAFAIGAVVAVVMAYFFARWLKKVLLHLEPEEIAELVVEKETIWQHVSDGIIALDKKGNIHYTNQAAQKLLAKADIDVQQLTIQSSEYQLLVMDVLSKRQPSNSEQLILDNRAFVISRNPIFINGKFDGAVLTLKDQTEMAQLITELSSTEQYNDVLRERNHHFMNQLHVLQGLLQLEKYEEAQRFMGALKRDYHERIGQMTSAIKVPVIAGLLLAKKQEALQQNIEFILDEDSQLNVVLSDNFIHELSILLGVLIDNAFEAFDEHTVTRQVSVYIDQSNTLLTCTVEDTGKGIDERVQGEIFKRGYSTKGTQRGYGLEAVMQTVQRYSGHIDVASQLNKGTCMTIEIPLDKIVGGND